MGHFRSREELAVSAGSVEQPKDPPPSYPSQTVPIQTLAKKKHTYVWQCVGTLMSGCVRGAYVLIEI